MRRARLHALFLTHLPRFEAHAACTFRNVRCDDTRADMTAEVVAIAWRAFVRLSNRGKKPEEFVTTLALRCSQAVRGGRRLAGSESARDALSRVAAKPATDALRLTGTTRAVVATAVVVGLGTGAVSLICPAWVGAVISAGAGASAVAAAHVGATMNRIFASLRLV